MKSLLSILSLSCFLGFSQEPLLTVQTGHASSILDVEFNPDGTFLATAGSDYKLVIWHFATSKQYSTMLGHTGKINAISFHPSKKLLISASSDSTVRVWDYIQGTEVESLKFDFAVNDLEFNSDGSSLFIAGEEVIQIDFNTFKRETIKLEVKNTFSTLELSNNDSLMFVGGLSERFAYLVNIETNELIRRFPHAIKSAKFNESKPEIIYSNNSGVIVAYDYKAHERNAGTTDWMLNLVNDIILDKNFIYIADNHGDIRIIEDEKWFQDGVLKGTNDKITSLAISNDRKYIASTGVSRSVVIWDIENRRVVKVFKGLVSQINDLKFSENGLGILVGYEDGSMRETDLISNQTIVNKMSLKSDILKNVGNFSVVDILEFNENSAELLVVYKQLHLSIQGSYEKLSEFEVHWDFTTNLLTFDKRKNLSPKNEKYIHDLKNSVYHENTYFLSDLPKTSVSDSLNMKASIDGQSVYLSSTINNDTIRKIETGHSGLLTAVAFNDRYGYLATAGWDGMIRFWNASTGDLMVVFGAFGDGQFVYITEEGYYFSSKNALAYIGFSMNGSIFSFEQFDLKYNRPDLVIKNLPYFDEYYEQAFQKAYKKRLDKLGVSAEDITVSLDLPTLTLNNQLNEQIVDNKLNISLTCEDQKMNLSRLHLYVNGVPEFGKEGKELKGKKYMDDIEVKLNEGTNIIQCYVTNESNNSSLKQTFKVQGSGTKEKDNLYLLTIGVSNYAENNYNLSYAAKDANDISNLFGNMSGYNLKKSTVLVDSAATKENILQMKSFMMDATENDVVVLFVAGHGVLDDNLDYYFAPYNMAFSDPAKNGVPFSVFDDMLEMTKSRKKIMFLDACHSGEIDKDEVVKTFVTDDEENQKDLIFRRVGNTVKNIDEVNSFELSKALFADMRVNNGATVISSSGGAEYAIEGDEWNNGVFTYVLLEALSTRKADKNNDKNLSISELQNFVQTGVHDRTGGLQTPTSRVENLNYDFVIVKK